MLQQPIDEAQVRVAAATVGLDIAAEHLPGVVMYFQMIASFADLVSEFPLDMTMESAAVYIPCSPATPE
jgi:hypothetical protein